MKRIFATMIVSLAVASAQAALPSLTELASKFTSLSERYEQLTNTLAETRARLEDSTARLAELTNSLAKIVSTMNSTRELRKAFHGEFVSHFVTNAVEQTIKRVDVYADGYEYTEAGRARKYLTPEQEAALAAIRKTKTLDDRIAAIIARISELEKKRDNGTNTLESAYAIIELAAKKKTLERLLSSRTNTVTMVVGGGK